MGEFQCVPVGEPYTAVGSTLAHGFWVGSSVNAVALGRQSNPHYPDGVIRSRRQIQRLLYIDATQIERWVIMVGGIICDACDLELAQWGRPLATANGCRVDRDDAVVFGVRKYALPSRINL